MDKVVIAFYTGGGAEVNLTLRDCANRLISNLKTSYVQQTMAQQILTQFQEHPDSWARVPDILERSSFPQTKAGIPWQSWSRCGVNLSFLVHRAANSWKIDHDTVEDATRLTTARQVRSYPDKTMSLGHIFLGIRNFIVSITVKVASDEVTLRKEKTYINKLNLALVQVSEYF